MFLLYIKMAITIIVKHESCDNLLKQTIDFLETI